jgi:hypothetical protein
MFEGERVGMLKMREVRKTTEAIDDCLVSSRLASILHSGLVILCVL